MIFIDFFKKFVLDVKILFRATANVEIYTLYLN